MKRIAPSLLQILSLALFVFGAVTVADGILPTRSLAPNPSWVEVVIGITLLAFGFLIRRMASRKA